MSGCSHICLFFFNETATTEIYTLSLHDALPISRVVAVDGDLVSVSDSAYNVGVDFVQTRSEEHTSELQSPVHLVCRLLLEKKKYNSSKAHLSSIRINASDKSVYDNFTHMALSSK